MELDKRESQIAAAVLFRFPSGSCGSNDASSILFGTLRAMVAESMEYGRREDTREARGSMQLRYCITRLCLTE